MYRAVKSWLVETLYNLTEQSASNKFISDFGDSNSHQSENNPDHSQQKINSLMSLLRKTPWWIQGHLRLGVLALSLKEIDLAFASFHAMRNLGAEKDLRLEMTLGLSSCYLARGKPEEAIKELQILPKGQAWDSRVKENLAAGYMAQENFKEALRELSEIPEMKRSAEISVTLDSLRDRLRTIKVGSSTSG